MKARNTTSTAIILPMLLTFGSVVRAEIYETSSMNEVFRHVDSDTLVVFDLDNTVIQAVGDWGSDQWYDHLAEHLSKLHSEAEGVARAEKIWAEAQHTTDVIAVEAVTPELIRKGQAAGARMIGLTARPSDINGRTIEQLKSIGVDLTVNGGTVIAIGATASKGPALVEYLARTGLHPKKIVFVDDKHHHVKSIDEALTRLGIPHACFRYGNTDARVADYHRRLAGQDPCTAVWAGAGR